MMRLAATFFTGLLLLAGPAMAEDQPGAQPFDPLLEVRQSGRGCARKRSFAAMSSYRAGLVGPWRYLGWAVPIHQRLFPRSSHMSYSL